MRTVMEWMTELGYGHGADETMRGEVAQKIREIRAEVWDEAASMLSRAWVSPNVVETFRARAKQERNA